MIEGMNKLGLALRAAREAKGWTMTQTADAALKIPGCPDIDKDHIFNLERIQYLRLFVADQRLPYVMKALEIPTRLLFEAVGLHQLLWVGSDRKPEARPAA